jgi:hypothetical protein
VSGASRCWTSFPTVEKSLVEVVHTEGSRRAIDLEMVRQFASIVPRRRPSSDGGAARRTFSGGSSARPDLIGPRGETVALLETELDNLLASPMSTALEPARTRHARRLMDGCSGWRAVHLRQACWRPRSAWHADQCRRSAKALMASSMLARLRVMGHTRWRTDAGVATKGCTMLTLPASPFALQRAGAGDVCGIGSGCAPRSGAGRRSLGDALQS